MQNFINFLELDKDGTWFVVLMFIIFVVLVCLIIKGFKFIVENLNFYKEYGVTLVNYCKTYDILDQDYAWEDAARKREYKKVVFDISRNDLIIPQSGITIVQAIENMQEFSRVLSMCDVQECVNLIKTNEGV